VTWFGNEVYTVGTQGPTTQHASNGEPCSAKCSVGFEGLEGVGRARRIETTGGDTSHAKALV
jgi:hypothetical protein